MHLYRRHTQLPKRRRRRTARRTIWFFPRPHVAHAILLARRRIRRIGQPQTLRLERDPSTLHRTGARLRHLRHPSDCRTTPARRAHLALPRRVRRGCLRQRDARRGVGARIAAGGGDQRSTTGGGSTPPPALLSTAQRDQVHSAAEIYIGTLEKEGRMIGETTASHLYSAPWAIPAAYHPAG